MDTKEKILTSMYSLLSKKGYENTSISSICQMVGIKKPSIYYYFDSKEQIIFELSDYIIQKNKITFEKDLEACLSISSKTEYRNFLISLVKRYMKQTNKKNKFQLFFMEMYIQANRIPILEDKKKELVNIIKSWIEKMLQHGMDLEVFGSNFNLNLNIQMIFNTLLGIECSYIYKMGIDLNLVWEETMTKLLY